MTDRQLREAIAQKFTNHEISRAEAMSALKNHTLFMYEDYTSINDLAHHLYKLVDADLMPFKVMCGIMSGSEEYYGEKWA